MIQKSEQALKAKHQEVDDIRKRLTIQESDLLRRYKVLEQKELIISKQADEYETKLEVFHMEKQSFDREKYQVTDLASKTREQSEVINKFKRDFDTEKERNKRLKAELENMQYKLQKERQEIDQEKSSLLKLQKNIEGLRYGFVKEYSQTAQNFTHTYHNTSDESIKPQIRDTFGYPPMPKRSQSNFGLLPQTFDEGSFKDDSNYNTAKQLRGNQSDNKFSVITDDQSKGGATAPYPHYNRGGTPKSRISNSPELDSGRLVTSKPFNLKSYMSQLKQYDKNSSINQAYITTEKEGLIKTKLDISTKIRTIGAGNDLGSSPRFKLNLLPDSIEN